MRIEVVDRHQRSDENLEYTDNPQNYKQLSQNQRKHKKSLTQFMSNPKLLQIKAYEESCGNLQSV